MHCKPLSHLMVGSVAGQTNLLMELLHKVQLAPAGSRLVAGSVLGFAAGDSGGGSAVHAPGTTVGVPTRVDAYFGA